MSEKTNFALIIAIWAAGLGAAAQYAKISVIFDRLDAHYPDAGVALGFVVSIVGFVGIAMGVFAGVFVARIRYRRALLWAMWAGAVFSALQALMPPLPVLLALRAGEGLSHLIMVVAAPTLIAQLSADRHRGLTLTLWSTFFSVAFSLLVALGLPLVDAYGIPALFAAHAVWLAVFAVVLTFMLKPLNIPSPDTELTLRGLVNEHIAIYRSPFLAAPAMGWLFYTFCFLAILTVLPPFIAADQRVFVMGMMPLVSIGVSMTFGVVLLRFTTAVQVVQIGFLGAVLCMIWLYYAPGAPSACLALAGAFGLVQGASFASVPQLNKTAQTQARANGALVQTGNIGNTLGTPVMLAVVAASGYVGLVLITILGLTAGFFIHVWLSARRKTASI